MIDEAVKKLSIAKDIHDQLEDYYIKATDFDIINDKVDICIRKYFAFLNKNDKKYRHNKKKSKFVCRLSFENGFVYPASYPWSNVRYRFFLSLLPF